MYQVEVYVMYKESILDPQGEAIKKAIHQLEFQEVKEVRLGKYFQLTLEKSERPVAEVVEQLCHDLLANEVMESYRYEIKEVN